MVFIQGEVFPGAQMYWAPNEAGLDAKKRMYLAGGFDTFSIFDVIVFRIRCFFEKKIRKM